MPPKTHNQQRGAGSTPTGFQRKEKPRRSVQISQKQKIKKSKNEKGGVAWEAPLAGVRRTVAMTAGIAMTVPIAAETARPSPCAPRAGDARRPA